MIRGGRSERNCKTCKLNRNQNEYNCGYIYTEETCNKDITFEFPELNDLSYYINICPVWYYNEYEYIYSTLNLYRESTKDLTSLPFGIRTGVRIADNYIEQIKIFNLK